MSAPLAAFERPRIVNSNTIFKSGNLLISSKGLGWKSWKKRWFILTRASLVFFKNDPSTLPQRGGEVNLTLGGIDLNNSGSVVVREDKKLLTVLFPDGRDGRAFTLKAETSEDLYEWKTALEHALAQAPSAALVMGHNGIFRNDTNDASAGSFHQCRYQLFFILILQPTLFWSYIGGRERRPVKSLVVGRPILLALEDIDGGPSFLEKALRFLEKYGIEVEGILRQSADVEEVERRVKEYEQGKNEFGHDEDAHVIGDCVKHVLRELPSSPVPASCCTALLEAYKVDRKESRVNAMLTAIQETFPEPNRRLLQRVLKMMHTISAHASENRMTPSAVAACMAPLLLRPLLAGECELEDDYDNNGDNSAQLLAAANAANNAQAIITTLLLEEYKNVFDDDSLNRCSISAESQTDTSGSEDSSDDEHPDIKINGYQDAENEVHLEADYGRERRHSGKLSQSSGSASDLYDYKAIGNNDSDDGSSLHNRALSLATVNAKLDSRLLAAAGSVNEQLEEQRKVCENAIGASSDVHGDESQRSMGDILSCVDQELHQSTPGHDMLPDKPMPKHSSLSAKKSMFWGRKNARKTPSTESISSSGEEELAIQRLETTKNDLRQRIAKEARGNAILQASLERRKQALHERRLALEQDVTMLQEQLQAERDLRAALEVGLSMSSDQFPGTRCMDSKTRAELEEIALAEADVARLKQKVAELHHQLNQQRQHHYGSLPDVNDSYQQAPTQSLPQKHFQQDFDTTLAVCNHERKQRTEELTDLRNINGPLSTSGVSKKQASWKQFVEPTNPSDSKNGEASKSLPTDNLCDVDSASLPSTSKVAEMVEPRNLAAASSTLMELTTRLDFFKERRSQLMEQLQKLDLNYGSMPHDFVYRLSSPPWN
ncbi:rho GTPase-activating protein 7-like isoform X2 [Salvia splendens]|uniref:rho GTPase-activating protein 7-like isoform X2 n=1 Tax=Salvia splendens TaxID=180675 RepID=UPI001C2768CD|nr:rho GTPase-activating protein 7-like isoform X2 [Salvia splendens]